MRWILAEAEAIALAIECHAEKLLVDDRLGRELARRHSVPATGLLGELIYAKLRGQLGSVATAMDQLKSEAHFYIREDLRQLVLNEAGEGGTAH